MEGLSNQRHPAATAPPELNPHADRQPHQRRREADRRDFRDERSKLLRVLSSLLAHQARSPERPALLLHQPQPERRLHGERVRAPPVQRDNSELLGLRCLPISVLRILQRPYPNPQQLRRPDLRTPELRPAKRGQLLHRGGRLEERGRDGLPETLRDELYQLQRPGGLPSHDKLLRGRNIPAVPDGNKHL